MSDSVIRPMVVEVPFIMKKIWYIIARYTEFFFKYVNPKATYMGIPIRNNLRIFSKNPDIFFLNIWNSR